ncbi:hypothetical protein N3S92_004257 [Cronobacter sakazakii]|nr:hypothetical protein [Cronobacter sakazakii]KAB0886870.1 hypothetical protein FZI56_21490 [Cronobacter sakazakii]
MKQMTAYEWARSMVKRSLIADESGEGIPFAGLRETLCLGPTFLSEILEEANITVTNGTVKARWFWEDSE